MESHTSTGMTDKTSYRVYVDGIFDLFHVGHLNMLRTAKQLYPNTTLIAGVVGDAVIAATGYKRTPIIPEADRAAIVAAIRFVDEVVVPAPLLVTREFVKQHNIDLIVHGFANDKDKDNFMKRHPEPLEMGIVKELPYTYNRLCIVQ